MSLNGTNRLVFVSEIQCGFCNAGTDTFRLTSVLIYSAASARYFSAAPEVCVAPPHL
jgi:hypothetical protein